MRGFRQISTVRGLVCIRDEEGTFVLAKMVSYPSLYHPLLTSN